MGGSRPSMTGVGTQTEPLLMPAAMPSVRHRSLRLLLMLVAGATTFIIVYLTYLCPAGTCGWRLEPAPPLAAVPLPDHQGQPLTNSVSDTLSFDDILEERFRFDMEGRDVIVFLHMQKTGGTEFGRHLVHDLQLKRPCVCHRRQKRCQCLRPGRDSRWLFSRYSTGWQCGLHADWTELTACVDGAMDHMEREQLKRRYFYITLLREPIQRYLSEWKHVRRGATWSTTRHWCGGREATETEIPSCYSGDDWEGVTLNQFLACDSNMASNRQTRMLADLHLVNCYSQTSGMSSEQRDQIMLASAKTNLRQMAFFGLTEQQQQSQYMFEEVFNLRFLTSFALHNKTHADSTVRSLRPGQLEKVQQRNRLDLQLYDYAKQLLAERFARLQATDASFEAHFNNLGNLGQPADSREVDR